jgi:hypothetical protein
MMTSFIVQQRESEGTLDPHREQHRRNQQRRNRLPRTPLRRNGAVRHRGINA